MLATLLQYVTQLSNGVNNMSDDIKASVVKGKLIYIANGFKSRNYTNNDIVTITVGDPTVKQAGRILNPVCKALEGAGADCYINKQQAGPAGSVFVEKSSITSATFDSVMGVDISEWLS